MPSIRAAIDATGAVLGSKKVQTAFNRIRRSARRGIFDLKRFNIAMATSTRRMRSFSLGGRALLGAFTGFLIIRKMTKTIAEFEDTLASVKGVTGATAEEFQRLNDTARELGATTRFTASQAGEGLLALSRAGFTVDEAITALPQTLNLAAAGMIDLGEASRFVANTLRQFGLDASETQRVADSFVVTANNANTDVRALAEALKFVGPVAGALDRDLEEITGTLGVLANAGLQGTIAGTNLRGIFARLLDITPKAQKVISRLGISMDKLNPQTNSVAQIFKEFGDAGLQAGDAVKIFGRRNVAAALVLKANASVVEELTQKQRDLAGEAERVALIQEDTLGGAFRALRSAIEEAFLSIGDSGFTGALRGVVEITTDVIRVLTGFEDKVKGNIDQIRGIISALKALLTVFAAIIALKVALSFLTLLASLNPVTLAVIGLVGAGLALAQMFRDTGREGNVFTDILFKLATELGLVNKEILALFDSRQALPGLSEEAGKALGKFEKATVSGSFREGLERDLKAITEKELPFLKRSLERALSGEAGLPTVDKIRGDIQGAEAAAKSLQRTLSGENTDFFPDLAPTAELRLLDDAISKLKAVEDQVAKIETDFGPGSSKAKANLRRVQNIDAELARRREGGQIRRQPGTLDRLTGGIQSKSTAQLLRERKDALTADQQLLAVIEKDIGGPVAGVSRRIEELQKRRDELEGIIAKPVDLSSVDLNKFRDEIRESSDEVIKFREELSLLGASDADKREIKIARTIRRLTDRADELGVTIDQATLESSVRDVLSIPFKIKFLIEQEEFRRDLELLGADEETKRVAKIEDRVKEILESAKRLNVAVDAADIRKKVERELAGPSAKGIKLSLTLPSADDISTQLRGAGTIFQSALQQQGQSNPQMKIADNTKRNADAAEKSADLLSQLLSAVKQNDSGTSKANLTF